MKYRIVKKVGSNVWFEAQYLQEDTQHWRYVPCSIKDTADEAEAALRAFIANGQSEDEVLKEIEV